MRKIDLKLMIAVALFTAFVTTLLSYLAFSERNAFELNNKGHIVCFAENHHCYKLVELK
jgi:hypothetical protein